MNRRSFLTFIGLGAIGAATCIEPPELMEPAQDAVAKTKDIERIPSYMEPESTGYWAVGEETNTSYSYTGKRTAPAVWVSTVR